MREEWDFYLCRIDDEPASIALDLGLIDAAPLPGFDRFGYLRVYMLHPRPDGLSSNEEFETLGRIEDSLRAAILAEETARFVGRTTSDGARTWYFYLAAGDGFEPAAAGAMAAHPGYEFDTGVRDDPEWRVYRDFLYPDPRTWQTIQNRRVIDVLGENGDDPRLSRPIEHWIHLGQAEAADAFAKWAQGEGFHVWPIRVQKVDEYSVQIQRVDSPAAIDDVVLVLYDRAQTLGGSYDGWECQVVKPG